ncbi:hypothetical protein ACHHYP_01821 [Achlya hypogyna]|uniref:Uncharacterized protein n=1 Tax=Achlya hypogyna TaxID=1202772 RepID=A0A1V9ZSU0_ACHHY|nr:hypothetical protein ACHHYP_01821 [Achlya hypogyna]
MPKRSAEDELNTKETFTKNLEAKLKAMRTAPALRVEPDEDAPVLLVRKAKRKRTVKAAAKLTAVAAPVVAASKPGVKDAAKSQKPVGAPVVAAPSAEPIRISTMSKSAKKRLKKRMKTLSNASANDAESPTKPSSPLASTVVTASSLHGEAIARAGPKSSAWRDAIVESSDDDMPTRMPVPKSKFVAQPDSSSDEEPPAARPRTEVAAKRMPTPDTSDSEEETPQLHKPAPPTKPAEQPRVQPTAKPKAKSAIGPNSSTGVSAGQPAPKPVVKLVVKPTAEPASAAPKKSVAKALVQAADCVKRSSTCRPFSKPVAVQRNSIVAPADESDASDAEKTPKTNGLEEAARAMKRLQAVAGVAPAPKVDAASKEAVYASIIDAAALERWDLVEIGRLVRLFCAPFGFKRKKTTRFLRRHCPELVCADFLEGLAVPLHGFQVVQLLQVGSTSPAVLSAKLSTCIEADVLKIADDSVLDAFVSLVDESTMSRDEIFGFAHGIVESLRTVDECCRVLRGLSRHWRPDATHNLVQRVLLSPVFDDLEGDPEAAVAAAFPELTKLEFPSRLDMEDTNADGNLDDLCVDDDTIEYDNSSHESDDALDEMEKRIARKPAAKRSERKKVAGRKPAPVEESDSDLHDDDEDDKDDAVDEEDSDDDGEAEASDEEDEADDLLHWNPTKGRPRKAPLRRSRFILDEASEDEDVVSEDPESSDDAPSEDD